MRRALLTVCLCLCALALTPARADWNSPGVCHDDRGCTDNIFCNGTEHCMPGAPGAKANGCIRANPMDACTQQRRLCSEPEQRCWVPRIDSDGDGHGEMRLTLPNGQLSAEAGDDCNDHDANEFPGNREVWDPADHD